MLWACEQLPVETRNDARLIITIQELLMEMVEWLMTFSCANYFITANNMMDCLTYAKVSHFAKVLLRFTQEQKNMKQLLEYFMHQECLSAEVLCVTIALKWVHHSATIYLIRDLLGTILQPEVYELDN